MTNSLPTVVTLNAKVMKNDEFHTRFSSDISKYQSNKPTKFKYLMNAPANLNEEYHVALLSTNFKNEFFNTKNMKILSSHQPFPISTIEHTIELLIIDYLNINKIERFCPKCAKTCEIVLLRVESGPFWSKKWSKMVQKAPKQKLA